MVLRDLLINRKREQFRLRREWAEQLERDKREGTSTAPRIPAHGIGNPLKGVLMSATIDAQSCMGYFQKIEDQIKKLEQAAMMPADPRCKVNTYG